MKKNNKIILIVSWFVMAFSIPSFACYPGGCDSNNKRSSYSPSKKSSKKWIDDYDSENKFDVCIQAHIRIGDTHTREMERRCFHRYRGLIGNFDRCLKAASYITYQVSRYHTKQFCLQYFILN